MEYSLEELKNRYRAIRLFEEGSEEEEKKRVGQTVCGFDFDPGHCRLCMYHDTCAGRIRGARSAGWQRRMQSFRALNELELAIRNSLNEKQSRQEPPGAGSRNAASSGPGASVSRTERSIRSRKAGEQGSPCMRKYSFSVSVIRHPEQQTVLQSPHLQRKRE